MSVKGFQTEFEPSSSDDASVYNPFEHTPVKDNSKTEPKSDTENPKSTLKNEKLAEVRKHLNEARDATYVAVGKAIDRGSELDALLNKVDELTTSSYGFKRQTTALRKQMWWDYIKQKSLLIFIVLLILAILITIIVVSLKKH